MINKRWRRVLANALWLAGGNASARLATLVALVIAARLLGPSAYGKFAAFQGISLFLTTFIGMGLTTWGVRSLSRGRSEAETIDPSLAIPRLGSLVLSYWHCPSRPSVLELWKSTSPAVYPKLLSHSSVWGTRHFQQRILGP